MLVTLLITLTLLAFAANSLLCRMALGGNFIDPMSFTTLRLLSGALVLIPVSRFVAEPRPMEEGRGSWGSGAALFVYAAALSLAYITLDTGMGALILFGAVQVTMIGAGIRSGEWPSAFQWIGLVAAFGGLAYLVWPGIAAPDALGAILMMISGIAWGVYSLRGKTTAAPIASTAGNFMRTVPMAFAASALAFAMVHIETRGVALALVSGAITSGLGYILWYTVLPLLRTTQAAIVQLLVPVLAAFGGVVFLAEHLSVRLVIASALILGGVAMAVLNRTGAGRPDTRTEEMQ